MYYIENDNKEIVLFDSIENNLINTKIFMPQYKDLEIKSTDKNIVEIDGKFYFEDSEEVLNREKSKKLELNSELRDAALLRGVEYNSILFDSDTDQKVNLTSIAPFMDDNETIVWYGKDGTKLPCSKQDLMTIGNTIKELTIYCWNKNSEIIEAINNAKTIEELNNISIEY